MSRRGEVELERLLATLLQAGTWLASAVIALGLILPRTSLCLGGIALLISLPVLRIGVMLAAFVRRRDSHFAIIAGLVLAIIALGVVVGLRARGLAA